MVVEGDGEGGGMVAVGGEREREQRDWPNQANDADDAQRPLFNTNNDTTKQTKQQVLPEAPRELVEELSRRYVHLYERITGLDFVPPPAGEPVAARIERALAGLK